MINDNLRVIHSKNRIQVTEKEYNGTQIVISNAVNAPMDFKIYGASYLKLVNGYPLGISPLSEIAVKCTNGNKTESTRIPLVGNSIEVSNFVNSNLTFNEKYYVADYILYDSKKDKLYRYKFINENLIDYTMPLKDQVQAILTEPIIEEIMIDNEDYCLKNIKSFQDKCEISLVGSNQFNFDEFVEFGGYSGIEYTNLENEKIYEYLGDEEYLYYNIFIPYDNDYKFSYKTTGTSRIVVRFYDEQQNNISNEIENIVEGGFYDVNQQGIVVNLSELNLLYKKETNISCFQIGFKVGKNDYFSDLNLSKLVVKQGYMDLVVKSLKDIEFNFDEFVENGQYSGIQYVNSTNEIEKVYKYIGNEEYLFYNFFVPYNNNYEFSYKINTIGETVVRFFNKQKNNISSEMVQFIEKGNYNTEQNGIVVNSTSLLIPHIEETNASYFQVGFKVLENSYFSDLCLKKQ